MQHGVGDVRCVCDTDGLLEKVLHTVAEPDTLADLRAVAHTEARVESVIQQRLEPDTEGEALKEGASCRKASRGSVTPKGKLTATTC